MAVMDEYDIIIFWTCTLMSCCECSWYDYSWLCNGERWADVLMGVFCRNWLVTGLMRTASLTCWVSFRAAVWMTSAVSWTSRPMERTPEVRIQTHSMTWSVSQTVSLMLKWSHCSLRKRSHSYHLLVSCYFKPVWLLMHFKEYSLCFIYIQWKWLIYDANNETAFVNIRSVFHC